MQPPAKQLVPGGPCCLGQDECVMAGWAAQVCSRLAEGLLTQVVPALLTTILRTLVVPVGAGSPLAQV